MRQAKQKLPPIQRDWVSKTLAGAVLGLTLAIGCSALFVLANPDMAISPKNQLAMWLVPPIALGAASGTYFFQSGLRAWLWLGAANAAVYAALAAIYLS